MVTNRTRPILPGQNSYVQLVIRLLRDHKYPNLTLLAVDIHSVQTNSVLCAIFHNLLISVTQCLPGWVEKIVERGIPSKSPNVDLEIQSHILASIVERGDGSANLVEPNFQVLGLPFPQNPVKITVM